MIRTLAIALSLVGTAASAATFDLGADFGAAPFSYGQVNANGTLTPYVLGGAGACTGNPNCYQGAGNFYQIDALASPGVLVHPGDDATENSAIRFTSLTAGTYKFTGNATLNSNGNNGNGTEVFYHLSGNPGVFESAALTTVANQVQSLSRRFTLGAGESFDLVLGNRGEYQYDATTFVGNIAAVPEPAAWALMIGGFGLVGGSLRRRRGFAVA